MTEWTPLAKEADQTKWVNDLLMYVPDDNGIYENILSDMFRGYCLRNFFI